ncbi:MAG: cobalt-precorrin 5A hydrolase [Desulfobacterium sp.]|jgi:cobalt-precorrin 5A hydrolase|nr:cobalt-precorrin 5A hydrolase [Desulfobacterium sp.]
MNIENKTAVWVLTRGGLTLSKKLKQKKIEAVFFVSDRFENEICDVPFSSLRECVGKNFSRYPRHLFIMATGIVIRVIADLISHKTVDPAVVSMDDTGRYVISLLSGHLGGANRLAREIAGLTGAEPVLSTATDVNQVPAIDMIAQEKGLKIENPEMIKKINMAFLEKEKVCFHDPFGLFSDLSDSLDLFGNLPDCFIDEAGECNYRVVIDDVTCEDDHCLRLRPSTLCVGIGCNRGTPESEIMDLLKDVFKQNALSMLSIRHIATIDIKKDEQGILKLSESLNVPVVFFENRELNTVKNVKNISQIVEKHTGAKSVCEAAAILAASNGELIVEKQKTKNVTLAVARITEPSILSV